MIDSTFEIINKRYPEHIRRYASGQYIATLSYYLASLPSLPVTVEILTFDGSFKSYYLKPFNLKKGLYAYLLLPVNKSTKELKITFRGTNFDEPKSIAINLEPHGPGTKSFLQEKNNIFNTLKQSLQEYYEDNLNNLILEVYGHSQGAALSQLFISEFIILRNLSSEFDCINAINMTVFNSPGIPHLVAKLADQAVLVQWWENKPLKILANYGMVGGDAIQVTGENMLFISLPSFLAQVNLLKVNKKWEGHWLKAFDLADGIQPIEFWQAALHFFAALNGAHSSINYYAPLDKTGKITVHANYEYFKNQNPLEHEQLRKELLNKAIYTQRFLYLPKVVLYFFIEHINDYRQFSPMSFVRNLFGVETINTWYQKLMAWFSGTATTEPVLNVLPQTITQVDLMQNNAPTPTCCPQFTAVKNNPSSFLEKDLPLAYSNHKYK